ncbi:MAG: hypothetical protein KF832_31725 [Caldilineaceae bacterium]|nr:hypothetical protein [Caldilineaceae bacterium]
MQRRILTLIFLLIGLVTACQPIQPMATTTTPQPEEAPPDLTDMTLEKWSLTAPDAQWRAEGLAAFPTGDRTEYYTELRIQKADGSVSWTPVAGWKHWGLGYTTPRPLAWSPAGNTLYFTNAPVTDGCGLFINASDLQAVDLTDGTVREILPTDSTWTLAVSPDGTQAAYRQADELVLLDLATGASSRVTMNLADQDVAWGNFTWSPDGTQLALTLVYQPCVPQDHSLVIVDIQNLSLTTVLEHDTRRLMITAWEEADQLLVTDPTGNIWRLTLSSGALEGLSLCSPTTSPQCTPSPDGQWLAETNPTLGILLHEVAQGQTRRLFPRAAAIDPLSWSPDSQQLLVVRSHRFMDSTGNVQVDEPTELWQVTITPSAVVAPVLVFTAPPASPDTSTIEPSQLVLGQWSPDARYVLLWAGPLGASIQADGLPLSVLDTHTQQVMPLADAALLNPHYQSWAPDSSALAFTAGGYRSAQVNKWLRVWESTSGQITTIVRQTEQVPGIVAWSPQGNWLAYAAVPAEQTGDEWADLMTFENPAIAGRRIYLVNIETGEQRPLDQADAFQDAPIWGEDGNTLFYVQQNGDEIIVMSTDLITGETIRHAASEPLPEMVGYYGQSDWESLLQQITVAP